MFFDYADSVMFFVENFWEEHVTPQNPKRDYSGVGDVVFDILCIQPSTKQKL